MKVLAIISALLIAIVLIFFVIVMIKNNWDFTKLTFSKFETNEYILEEVFESISIKTSTSDISLKKAEDNKTKIVCYEHASAKHIAAVENGTLKIEENNEKKWYEKIINLSFKNPSITLYLPAESYNQLVINERTGDISIPQGFVFNSIDIIASTGDVTNYSSVIRTLKIKTSTGDILAEDINAEEINLSVSTGDISVKKVRCTGEINVETDTGDVIFTDVECKSICSVGDTGDIRIIDTNSIDIINIKRDTGDVIIQNTKSGNITVNTSTGDVKFDLSDADEITVKTSTGDVKGALLSPKIFYTSTSTGKVSVPKSTVGGLCDVTTSTGNIIFTIIEE